ncbi:MAG: glycosyltransferase family 39 protein [Planctomycetes bacterium]|nr:glycosyltransferase family 39 protein [Planctomycetota bacterium]
MSRGKAPAAGTTPAPASVPGPPRAAAVGARAVAVILLAALSAPVLTWRLGEPEVSGVLEARVAITAREMGRKGEWVLPTMHGEPRLQKPPLAYWLVILAAEVRGRVDEWALRAPFALLGAGTVLFAWGLGSLLLGGRWGVLAALALLTSPLFQKELRLAASDGALAFAAAGAWWLHALARKAVEEGREGCAARVGFWLLVAAGALAKGPVILALVLLPALVEAAAARSRAPLKALWSPSGIALCLVLSLAWPALVVREVGWEAAWRWFLESFGKVLPSDGVEDGYRYQRHSGPLVFYLLRLPAYLGPWVVPLAFALWAAGRAAAARWRRAGCQGAPAAGLDLMAAAAFVAVLALFSLVEEKKGAYLLPAAVPAAVLAAQALRGAGPRLRAALRPIAGALAAAAGIAAAAAVLLGAWPEAAGAGIETAVRQGGWRLPACAAGIAVCLLGSRRLLPGQAGGARPFVLLGAALALGSIPYLDARSGRAPGETPMKAEALATARFLRPDRVLHGAGNLPLDFLFYLDPDLRTVHAEADGKPVLDPARLAALAEGDQLLVSWALAAPLFAGPLPRAGGAEWAGERPFRGPLAPFRLLRAIHPDAPRERDRALLLESAPPPR